MVKKKNVPKISPVAGPTRSPKKQTASSEKSFPIVGVGASAGGLDAFKQLLGSLPQDIKMAFVFVSHLDPKHASMLTEILSKETVIPVHEVKDGMMVLPGHVYVIPPNADMDVLNRALSLSPRREERGQHLSIDHFFRSLAMDQKENAIGIILSGTASDGTMGLTAIKAEGGITFAQEEKSAKYDGMPHSAIAADVVDFILPPDKIAKELVRIQRHPFLAAVREEKADEAYPEGDDFNKIFILLRNATGVDFSLYKPTTIRRRVARRMLLHRIDSLNSYVRYLREKPSELKGLFQDMLINVTSFFRDKDVFDSLKEKIFDGLIKNRPPNMPIRVWVPGCSTGEEAYSIAICLVEYLSEKNVAYPIQIFATDISEQAIDKARAGVYREEALADVSPERLRRFFLRVDGRYEISKNIRDMCVFAKQDLAKDPPFSRMDLISCRNVLIYLNQTLQKKILPTFHYSLNPNGILLLGASESIGVFADLFTLIDKKNKIYGKQMTPHRMHPDFAASKYEAGKIDNGRRAAKAAMDSFDLHKEADRLIIARYAPAGVLIDENMQILQFRGQTGDYLEPASGPASLNLLKMAREGLMVELHSLIQECRKKDAPVSKAATFKYGTHHRGINIEVIPIKPYPISKERYFLVLFKDVAAIRQEVLPKDREPVKTTDKREMNKLRQELKAMKEYLESNIAEHEATNEELRSAVEEIQSSNEELQSTNEELETAKEELQSTNEELTTVNEELQNRNSELGQINSDIVNILGSTNIPIIILGSDMRIRRFTQTAEKVLNLISTDIGRPLSDLRPNIEIPNMQALITDVIDNLHVSELELQDREGRWYSMRIRPYKTLENRIDGVIISFIDIDVLKRSLKKAEDAYEYANAVIETVREPLMVLESNLRVKTANKAFFETFHLSKEETENRYLYNLGEGQWNIPSLRELLEEILPKNTAFQNFEVEADFPTIGRKRLSLNARRIVQAENGVQLILLAMEEMEQ